MIGMIFAMKNIRNFRFIHPLVGVLYYCIVTSFLSCGEPVNISDGGNGTNQSGCTWHNSKSAVYYDPYLLLPCSNGCSDQVFENFNLDDPHCPIPFVLEKSSGTVYFPDNIILTSGSQATHFTGMNVVNSFCFTGNMKVYTDKGIISFISFYITVTQIKK